MVNNSTMGVKAIMSFLEIVGKIYRGVENGLGLRELEPQPLQRGASVAGHTPLRTL
jgi:hypothetical protein